MLVLGHGGRDVKKVFPGVMGGHGGSRGVVRCVIGFREVKNWVGRSPAREGPCRAQPGLAEECAPIGALLPLVLYIIIKDHVC